MLTLNKNEAQDIISDEPLLLIGGMSRSGTTLLTTVFDAHPDVSMGTELIPGPVDAPSALSVKLDKGLELADGNFAKAGRALAKDGDYPVGVFFSRCYRAGLTLDDVREVLDETGVALADGVNKWPERLRLAWAMMRRRWLRDGTSMFGFKLNASAIAATSGLFPGARFVCIIRDPYDIAHSQLKNGFTKDVSTVIKSWNAIVAAYETFARDNPHLCAIVRYEDLVRSPHRTLERVFDVLPIGFDPAMLAFNTSKANVLKASDAARHPNLAQLRRGFFHDSIGGGRAKLEETDREAIATQTQEWARTSGYASPSFLRLGEDAVDDLFDFIDAQMEERRAFLKRKRRFHIDRYEEMLAPYTSSHEVMRLCDYVRQPAIEDRNVLLIRHDVDHDIENAVRIAEWEHERGLRTTYCILHSAWYYGRREGNRYAHSRLVFDSIRRLLELGHEINFHNNLLAMTLQEGIDPAAMLHNELDYWDGRGVPIVGTSMHGDRLCRELDFRNSEFFAECIEERFGGPRRITHVDAETGIERTLEVGQASMFDFGLEYEAYDIARDTYHNDSGGNIRTRTPTRGRRDFGRDPDRGEVIGVLTHPIWWDLDEVPAGPNLT